MSIHLVVSLMRVIHFFSLVFFNAFSWFRFTYMHIKNAKCRSICRMTNAPIWWGTSLPKTDVVVCSRVLVVLWLQSLTKSTKFHFENEIEIHKCDEEEEFSREVWLNGSDFALVHCVTNFFNGMLKHKMPKYITFSSIFRVYKKLFKFLKLN